MLADAMCGINPKSGISSTFVQKSSSFILEKLIFTMCGIQVKVKIMLEEACAALDLDPSKLLG